MQLSPLWKVWPGSRRRTWAAVGGAAALMLVTSGWQEAASRSLQTPGAADVAPGEITIVDIQLRAPTGGHRWATETAAHVAAVVDTTLAQLPGLWPRLAGARPRWGWAAQLAWRNPDATPTPWRLTVDTHLSGESLEIRADLCSPSLLCSTHETRGFRLYAEGPAVRLARSVVRSLGDPALANLVSDQPPASQDPYAVLVLGRSAAVVSGLIEPPPDELRGHWRHDPVYRAVLIDPEMTLGWSLLARWSDRPEERLAALERMSQRQAADWADLALARTEAGEHAAAWQAWTAYEKKRAGDPRFVVARAVAAARSGSQDRVLEILSELPEGVPEEPATVLTEVALAESEGQVPEALLSEWQDISPWNPAPVRRRLTRMMAAERLEEALTLTPELGARGALEEAHRLTLALASDLGDRERAAEAAGALGRVEVARRLRMAAQPESDPDLLAAATSPEARLRRAELYLHDLHPKRALDEVRGLLSDAPWWPEALDLERRAWQALGSASRAAAAEARVLHVDPLFYESR